jgi:hypothetical protein
LIGAVFFLQSQSTTQTKKVNAADFCFSLSKAFFFSFFLFDFSATKVVGKVMTPSALFSTKKKEKNYFFIRLVELCQMTGLRMPGLGS